MNKLAYPDNGLHRDIPEEIYHSWLGASNSRLTYLLRSPVHCKYAIENPSAVTPALKLGRAVHYAVLQGDLFKKKYAIAEGINRRTKAGKEEWEKLVEQYGEEHILTKDEHGTCLAIREALYQNRSARLLVENLSDVELSGVWEDLDTGAHCKMRVDGISESFSVALDLKTTTDASPQAFKKQIATLGYHRQGAFYLDGLTTLNNRPFAHFSIIAIEKTPPYGVAVYRLDSETLLAGKVEVKNLLELYAECEAQDTWPAYSEEVQDISLPAWALKQENIL